MKRMQSLYTVFRQLLEEDRRGEISLDSLSKRLGAESRSDDFRDSVLRMVEADALPAFELGFNEAHDRLVVRPRLRASTRRRSQSAPTARQRVDELRVALST